MSKIVIALGGNALGKTPYEQLELVRQTAKPLADLIAAGHHLVIAHGNGPQVGMIHLGMATAARSGAIASDMPLPECGAMSQGYIGYHLQNALRNELNARGLSHEVATLVTQVVVSPDDPAFLNPTKPVGTFYTEEEAKTLMAERGCVMVEDAGRGWRQVVPSPMPLDVVELESVKTFLAAGHTVITVGGGGIPVVEDEQGLLTGTAAVIDKDLASEKLAEDLDADALVILTAVEQVAIHFNKPNQQLLSALNTAEAKQYMAEGHFAPGSMLPKMEAAVKFAESKEGRKCIITSLEKAVEALEGRAGTTLTR